MTKMIQTKDPYLELYAYEKMKNPSKRIVFRAYNRRVVDGIDWLEREIGMSRDKVETSDDWMAISKILEFWSRTWPNEWSDYVKSMREIRATRARKDGYSKEKGVKGMRYLGALPPRLMRLIKVYFPYQQWNREFVDKFTNNIKISKVGEKVDTWFTIPNAPQQRKDVVKEAVEKLLSELKEEKKEKNGNTKHNPRRS
jgi:hypothetical protein